jgi:prolyl oligopeptidase
MNRLCWREAALTFVILPSLLYAQNGGLRLNGTLHYPQTRKGTDVDFYFGTRVPDPYAWLENDTSGAVARWVAEENAVTDAYLAGIPFRAEMKARLAEVYNYPKYSAPFKKLGKYVFAKNDGLQNQFVLYIQEGRDGTPLLLLDPNALSADGTAALAGYSFSNDMRYMAYGISQGGSDWRDVFVMDVATRKPLQDHLRWVKFSAYAWEGDGFFYSRFDTPADTASALSASNDFESVWYHRVGTEQKVDRLVFEDRTHPRRFNDVVTTEDERFEILSIGDPGSGRRGNALYVRDVRKGGKAFTPVVTSFDDEFDVIDDLGEGLLVQSNRGAPNWNLLCIDPAHPEEKNWMVILPEKTERLQNVGTAGGKIFAVYMKDVASRAYVYDSTGHYENEIPFPTYGTVYGPGGERDDSTVFYTFNSFTFPQAIYEYNIRTRRSTLFRSSEVKFDPAAYTTTQVFYNSKDGTRVPMFLVHRNGVRQDGRNPVLLYGYGGFNISIDPGFDPLLIPLLDQGVIYASANIRGGAEYGEKWHEGGMKLRKQNVFDDFIGAAEWLIANRYTQPSLLAIRGASNGGLLIGAVMTQRPDLFRVAIPEVGVMDMLKYQKFTIGWNWASDLGSSDDSTQFRYIYRYSPLHNIRERAYPATLATTADHDDRVVPAHTFKFIATLQEKQRGPSPVIVRIDAKSGHHASNTMKEIEKSADIYSFILHNLGVVPKF